MSQYVEFTGKNTEEALAKAQEHFSLPLNRLEVEVVSAGSSGLFGLLGKKAKVRVRPAVDSTQADLAALAAVVSEKHHPRKLGESLASPPPATPTAAPAPVVAPPAQPQKEAVKPAPPEPKPSPVAPAGQPAAPATPVAAAAAPVATPSAPAQATPAEAEVEEEIALEEENGEAALENGAAEDDEEEEAVEEAEEDQTVIEDARQVLARLVSVLDEKAVVQAKAGSQGVWLEIVSQDAGVLIGRRGQNLEALQYLTTRIVSHKAGRPVRVAVDAGGYRQRRVEALEELARKAAQKARSSGRAVSIGPLASQERRIVHLTLRHEPGIGTSSRGRGEMKKVLVSPR